MRPVVTVVLMALAAILASPPSVASGTSGGGYGSGGGSSLSTPRDPAAEAYSRGKSMVKKHIACKKCAFPGGVQDTVTARNIAERVRAGEFGLKPADREQVLFYLQRRFGA